MFFKIGRFRKKKTIHVFCRSKLCTKVLENNPGFSGSETWSETQLIFLLAMILSKKTRCELVGKKLGDFYIHLFFNGLLSFFFLKKASL